MMDVRGRSVEMIGAGDGGTVLERMPNLPEAEVPFRGIGPCACGGTWRYILAGTDVAPVWRCLHCGMLSTLRSHLDVADSSDDGDGDDPMASDASLRLYQEDGRRVLAADGRAWEGITDALTALRQLGWTLDDVRTFGEDGLTYTFCRGRSPVECDGR